MSRKVFVDLGAMDGSSTQFFRRHYPGANEFEYYLFEPLPANIKKLNRLDNVTVMPYAAWWYNGVKKLYTGLPESGSLFQEKRSGNLDGKKFINVQCFDFSSWLYDTFTKKDYIILKMNVEGAEYQIIKSLVYSKHIKLINKLYVQWHWDKIGMSKAEHDNIVSMLEGRKVYKWEAMFGDVDIQWFKQTL